MMMRVMKAGEAIETGTDHVPPIGAMVSISKEETTLAGRVQSVIYDVDADEIPAKVRALVALI